ncbi:PREDICTED: Fanconi anemia core complex-associated protein 24 isoform X2 [Calidris pugnax]|uniref:Fanconi anemia core complex-associated protein 24 isoform X2 n=1 Tax=Calidris pugnax TaxID=198806 RepID=UPI00071CE70B|nr:PREDICTED: Fanconi anemia core complex-associated protein 24 isoform X2 [Calidris pugnax]
MTTKAKFPVTAGSIVVPYGHVIGNEKWRGSEIAQRLQADLVAGDEFKRRLVRFRNASSLGGIVIVEKTQISDQYFLAVQKLVVLELGMVLLPVTNQREASQLITQLVREQSKDLSSNPFLRKQCSQLAEPSLFRTVQQIPGVGKTKALLLLQQFGSIHRLCNASVKELELVVGQTLAQQIYRVLCISIWLLLLEYVKEVLLQVRMESNY